MSSIKDTPTSNAVLRITPAIAHLSTRPIGQTQPLKASKFFGPKAAFLSIMSSSQAFTDSFLVFKLETANFCLL